MTRACSTPGCRRTARPDWAMCDDCLDDLFRPLTSRASRPGRPDLARQLGAESRDADVQTEALGASRALDPVRTSPRPDRVTPPPF